MARFFGEVYGGRGKASRVGHASIRAHVRGWECGVEIVGKANGDQDEFTIYATHGSNGVGSLRPIATITKENNQLKIIPISCDNKDT